MTSVSPPALSPSNSASTESVFALFDGLSAGGLTLVIVTHEDQVAAHAQRRVRMVDGVLTEEP